MDLCGQKMVGLSMARAAVFEYIEIFFNRQRLHESNDYLTPEEYYTAAMAA